ncbi:islet cell autoantigen 1-like protein [Labeo rohita]|uniref:Islet cell autoantigen 1-like protein n=1 Tax=Labeo rohita TaxID=84645 RepID=A0A498LRY9_LABRO|nr:islet cell autoantigen 1-like protein [Labeo rohita]
MQSEEVNPEAARPKRQVRPPVYLEDYDLTATHPRQVRSPTRPHAAEESKRGDDARISPSPYDTASSSVSQHSWHVVDEWSSAAFDREHSYERQQVRAPSQSEAPLPSAQPAQFSPFHRPWEETESQSSPQTVINASHRRSQPLVHSESLPTPLPYPSTIRQSLQLADTVAAPVISVPSFDKGDYSSLPTPKQTVGYRDHSVLPRHLDRNAESLQREHVLVEFLGKMLSELQVMRDHIQPELPAKREVTQSIQPPNYHDPMPADYPDESVRPTSRRLAPPPTASSNYPHDPGWYPEQRFEPVRAAQLPHPHESYERRRPGYLTPMRRTSTLHPDDRESTYRGPTPSIPDFITGDPSEFTRLKIALENLLPSDATELFRYQILMDHLRLDEARLVADSYLNSPFSYSDTMAALIERFGQPYKLALRRIAKVMDAPDIRRGDTASFDKFALQIRSLVGMLETLGHEGQAELRCGSHVERLLSKLPPEMRSEFRRHMFRRPGAVYNLVDFSEWLQYEAWCQSSESQISDRRRRLEQKMDRGRAGNTAGRLISIEEETLSSNLMQTGNDDTFSGGQEKDGLSLLNEILGSSSLEDGGFSQEWREVFGEDDSAGTSRAETQLPEEEPAFFLPSKLLDQNMNDLQSTVSGWTTAIPQNIPESSSVASQTSSKPAVKDTSKDLSAWFSLFADLDPLSNPDAIGRTDEERELLNA